MFIVSKYFFLLHLNIYLNHLINFLKLILPLNSIIFILNFVFYNQIKYKIRKYIYIQTKLFVIKESKEKNKGNILLKERLNYFEEWRRKWNRYVWQINLFIPISKNFISYMSESNRKIVKIFHFVIFIEDLQHSEEKTTISLFISFFI